MVTFAVVAVLGVLPTGISTLQQAMHKTVEAQIVRGLGANFSASEFSALPTSSQVYFDNEGAVVNNGKDAYYTANITVTDPAYPNSSESTTINLSLRVLHVELKRNYDSVNSRYAMFIANSGKG